MRFLWLGLAATLCLAAGSSPAETGSVNVLNKAGATRAEAIGGAATAVGRDATLIWINPASLAQVGEPSLTLAGQRGYFTESVGQVLLTAPLAEGVMAFGCMYYNTGEISTWTPEGGKRTMSIQQDFMGAITYGRAVSSNLAVGATLKGLNSALFDEVSSAAFAGDLGAQYRFNSFLKAGLAVQNVGTKLRYLDDEIALPAMARAGLALGMPSAGGRDLLVVTSDAEYPLEGAGITWSAGAEYQWSGQASLRTGLRIPAGQELATLSFGAGLVFQQYRIDYSVRMGKEFDSPQTISLTMAFPRAMISSPINAVVPPASEAASFPAPGDPAQPGTGMAPAATETSGQEAAPPQPPQLLPGAPAPLPMAPANGGKKGDKSGVTDDLNRELDELLRQTGEK